jgi:hypothetical protein
MGVTERVVLSTLIATIPLVAQAEGKDAAGQVSLAPAASYNAKWDACEALARRRGTPPARETTVILLKVASGMRLPLFPHAVRSLSAGKPRSPPHTGQRLARRPFFLKIVAG